MLGVIQPIRLWIAFLHLPPDTYRISIQLMCLCFQDQDIPHGMILSTINWSQAINEHRICSCQIIYRKGQQYGTSEVDVFYHLNCVKETSGDSFYEFYGEVVTAMYHVNMQTYIIVYVYVGVFYSIGFCFGLGVVVMLLHIFNSCCAISSGANCPHTYLSSHKNDKDGVQIKISTFSMCYKLRAP